MKIKYTFANGEKTEVEVSEEIGAVIIDSRRAEETMERKHRYHCYSYDAADYEGLEYADKDSPETTLISIEDAIENNLRLRKGLESLTEVEKRRFLLFSAGLTYREIARRENVSSHSKSERSQGRTTFEGVDFATLFCGLNLYTKGYIITRKVGVALCGFIFLQASLKACIFAIKKAI